MTKKERLRPRQPIDDSSFGTGYRDAEHSSRKAVRDSKRNTKEIEEEKILYDISLERAKGKRNK